MTEDYCIQVIKTLIESYKVRRDNADSSERIIYSIVIVDLTELLTEMIHR